MKGMKIIVCAKQIPDSEVPSSLVKVDTEQKRVTTSGVPPVINPFDKNALEAALQIKQENEVEITVISMGEKISASLMKKVLAVGADKLLLLNDPQFEVLDSRSTAFVLSTAIKKIGEFDIILTGRQAGDWDSGQTGLILAEMLGIAGINLARNIRIDDGKVNVEKNIAGGYETVRAEMPALVTVSSEVGELRYVPLKGLMEARKQSLEVWNAEDLEIEPGKLTRVEMATLSPPPDLGRDCSFMKGGSAEEQGKNLAGILHGIMAAE
ncbi:MAG: electron transfer flavoprotein subunit beta/FixA family protein [Dehalococcoidales bacterium]|jgi:electron transfer flavoprotein beta subunit|nr:electron transfer flavoprotein subunit beta/FixA family protein [Dehalococcoidales bacterium]|tara:strand:- start:98 stop:898 length:801 start_codon:yes stop_codon:yes gene_type:complete